MQSWSASLSRLNSSVLKTPLCTPTLLTLLKFQQLEAQRAQQQKEQQQQPDYEYEDYPAASGSACPAGRLDTRVQYQPPDCSRKARKGDKLRMHYVGKLLDGTKVGGPCASYF